MRELQERQKRQENIRKILSSRWTMFITLIILFFLIKGNIRIFKNYLHIREKYNQDQQFLEDLKKRDIQLNKDIERLKTENGLDYEIRKKLDVSKADEKVIKIIDKR